MRRGSALARLAIAALAVASLAACSGDGPHAVTASQADRLAEMLFTSYDAGGMTFEMTAQPSPGETTTVTGKVDFTTGIGYALVDATGADAPVKAAVFSSDVILESIPTLEQASEDTGGPSFVWVSRQVDTSAYDLDGLLGIVLGLAQQQRDNPELIQQSGTTWLRSDTLRGTKVDVFEYSDQARFWIAADGSTLLRFEGNNALLTRPVIVDVLELGPVQIPEISTADIVNASDLGELYGAYRNPATP